MRRLHPIRFVVAFAVVVVLAGCPADNSVDAGVDDVGQEDDAGTHDVEAGARDDVVARDIRDVRDTLDPDVEPDVGSLDPEWELMPDLPEFCTLERALHPERLAHPMWENCGPGCEWMVPHPTHVRSAQRASGYHDGETGYAWVSAYPIGPGAADTRRSTWIIDSSGQRPRGLASAFAERTGE